MEDQPIRVMDMHAIVEEAGGKAVFVKTYVPLYGENRTEVYDGVVKMDADGNVITKQKITAREGYQFPPATLDFEAFHTKILDKVLSEVRAKIAMNPDPVISGFVSPPTTNPFMHECQGYIPARVPRWWRHHRHHRHRRHRLGEGDENYDVPSEPIPARELVYTASPDSVSVSGASAPILDLNPAFASSLGKRKNRKAARKAEQEAERKAAAEKASAP